MIFGEQKPKIVFHSEDYLLDHAVMTPEFSVPKSEFHTSVLNGHRELVVTGDYAEFTILVHLHKYPDPSQKFVELYSLYRQEVCFYPHREAHPVRDSNGNPVLFVITEMKPGYLQNYHTYDILSLTLKSKDFVDLSQMVVYYSEPPAD